MPLSASQTANSTPASVRRQLAGAFGEQAVLQGSASVTPNIANGSGATYTVTVTGAAVGDFVVAALAVSHADVTHSAYVSSANTVSVRFQNNSGSTFSPGATTLRVRVFPVNRYLTP